MSASRHADSNSRSCCSFARQVRIAIIINRHKRVQVVLFSGILCYGLLDRYMRLAHIHEEVLTIDNAPHDAHVDANTGVRGN